MLARNKLKKTASAEKNENIYTFKLNQLQIIE